MSVRHQPGPAAVRIDALLSGLDGLVGKTGWFETAKYADGTPVAYVATVQEYGSPEGGIPPRPTLRPTAADKGRQGGEWSDLVRDGARAALDGRIAPAVVLEHLTLKAAGDVAKSISALMAPPLSPQTIARKGFSKPLVETGQMLQSVTGVVERAR